MITKNSRFIPGQRKLERCIFLYILILTSICLLAYSNILHAAESLNKPQTIVLLDINGAIGPASQMYIERGIDKAIQKQADLVIIYLDTPGGLDKSMRLIVRKIFSSPIPIATYVAPSGARAASAGTFILYASHIAAMAPGTNLGAATPVNLTGSFDDDKDKKDKEKSKEKTSSSMEQKVKSDASAYIRSLAQTRGRNVTWAEQAVLQGASLSANEALKLGVIDFVAADLTELLQNINTKKVIIQGKTHEFNFTKPLIHKVVPDWRINFLAIITDPNVAYILLLLGVYGLFFEFMNPGFFLPGVAGLISLLIALYAFQLLPINYVGLALILIGISFMISEAFVTSFGALGVGGIIAFIVGSVMLYDTTAPGFQIMMPIILSVAFITLVFILFVANLALRSRRKPIVSGKEELLGSTGYVVYLGEKDMPRIRLRGELWQIQSKSPLKEGQRVKVVGMDELILIVEPINGEVSPKNNVFKE